MSATTRTSRELHAEHALERAFVSKLEQHERTIIAREDARHHRRALAAGPGPMVRESELGYVDLAPPVATPAWHQETGS